MTGPVTLHRHGDVALVVIENPPVNAIGHSVRVGLLAAVEETDRDAAIRAIVIHGAGRNFIAGADIRELDTGPREPLLNDLLLRLEACRKPVVAAMHGSVLGAGVELALASHYRCATRDVQIGMPEIKLGLLPGSGGTQRLPRAIGLPAALDLMLSGEPIDFAKAQAAGLIDHAIEGDDVVAGALAYARQLVAANAQPRRLRDQPVPDAARFNDQFFEDYRRRLPRAARGIDAAERILECAAAAVTMPFDQALAFSRKCFEECRTSVQSAALRHLFFAERGKRTEAHRPVEHIAVVGAGTMGSGIAVACATAGLKVTLIDNEHKSLESGIQRVHRTIDGSVQKGRMTEEAGRAAKARTAISTELGAARETDLVIEAVFENMAVKQDVFKRLDEVCRPGAILATNTSTLDIDAIASATRRAEDVVGMHFFSPANVMRLIEVVRGKATSDHTIDDALTVARRLGKIGVVVGNCFGFVGNRMLYAYGRENQFMLLEGAPARRIDAALENFGMAMGPNAVGDLAGLDVGYRVRRERKDLPNDPRYYRVADMLVEAGRYGQKTGKGIYRYDAERTRHPDPEVTEMIRAEAARLGVVQREISDAEIVERCICALINEGARILEEGIAASPSDIDVIWVNGYGFPRTRGGPMFYADTIGLRVVLDRVLEFQKTWGPQYWTPAPLLEQLAREGLTFAQWHAARTA